MATQLSVPSTRQDIYLIDPNDLFVDFSLRGRYNSIPTQKEIEDLAHSMRDNTQLQHVKIRKNGSDKPKLVWGYTRYQAASWLNENYKLEGKERFRLKCINTTCNDEEAIRQNIIENKERHEITAYDDAVNQRRLKEEFGYTDAKIAELYKCTVAWVSNMRKLLVLPSDIQKQIGKEISTSVALQLADLSEADARNLIQEKQQSGGKVKLTDVKKAKRSKVESTGDTTRSMKELKAFWDSLTSPAEDDKIRKFARSTMDFIKGKSSEKAYENAIKRFGNNE